MQSNFKNFKIESNKLSVICQWLRHVILFSATNKIENFPYKIDKKIN